MEETTMVKAEVVDDVDSFIKDVQEEVGLNKAETVEFILEITARESAYSVDLFMNSEVDNEN